MRWKLTWENIRRTPRHAVTARIYSTMHCSASSGNGRSSWWYDGQMPLMRGRCFVLPLQVTVRVGAPRLHQSTALAPCSGEAPCSSSEVYSLRPVAHCKEEQAPQAGSCWALG